MLSRKRCQLFLRVVLQKLKVLWVFNEERYLQPYCQVLNSEIILEVCQHLVLLVSDTF